MKKTFKIIGIIALIFLVIGVVFTGIAIVCGVSTHSFTNDKFGKFIVNPKVEEIEYTVVDEFDSIELNLDAADIVIKEGKEFAIEYALYEKASYDVRNNTLSVESFKGKRINIGFGFKKEDTYLTIYVPKDKEISIKKIDADMGNIEILNGKSWKIKNINIDADMGNTVINGDVEGKIKIEADMGNVDIKGNLMCDVSVNADMGDVDICTYYNEKNYNYEIEVDLGQKNIDKNGGEILETDKKFDIEVECDMGDVKLTFEDK